jgi:hypothetical protein
MGMSRSMCVHIGLHKTATTTLQRGLFANHPEIEFLGKRAGHQAEPGLRRCSSEAAFRLGNQLFWDHARSIDVDEAKRLYREEILPTIEPNRTLVFSFEGLAAAGLEDRKAVAQNLRDVFGSCRIILGIRRPVDLVEALYFQRMKRRHLGVQAGHFGLLRSPSTEEWLESVVAGSELAEHLDYARTARIFVEALGRANVAVFALEYLKAEPDEFARSLCEFLEIDAQQGVRLLEGRRHNVRLTQPVVDRMLNFERPGIRSALYAMSGRAIRKRILGVSRSEDSPNARLSISKEAHKSIEGRTREGNRWIAKEWGLPLKEYGYAV